MKKFMFGFAAALTLVSAVCAHDMFNVRVIAAKNNQNDTVSAQAQETVAANEKMMVPLSNECDVSIMVSAETTENNMRCVTVCMHDGLVMKELSVPMQDGVVTEVKDDNMSATIVIEPVI